MKPFLLSLTILLSVLSATAQTVPPRDTANEPIWVEMMRTQGINLFETQRAFEKYWEGRPIIKGCGYKAFKRWEYMAKLHSDGKGNITWPGMLPKTPRTSDKNFGVFNFSIDDSTVNCYDDSRWEELGPKLGNDIGRINNIAFHPGDSNTMICGAASGGLWKTKDGGKTWMLIADSIPTQGFSSAAFDPANPSIIYAGTGDKNFDAPGMGIYKSVNGGISWQSINSGLPSNCIVFKIIITQGTGLLMISTDNGIYRSFDGGKKWKQSSITGIITVKDLVQNPKLKQLVFAGGSGYIYKSSDTGKTFTRVTKGISTSGYNSAIAVTAADSSYVYFMQCDQRYFTALYRSVNFGDSFALMSTSPNLMGYESDGSDAGNGQAYYCMDVNANPKNRDEVFVGGINIFRSGNGGKNWTIFAHWLASNAQPIHADIHSLEFSPVNNNLYSTNDGGVYYYNKAKKWLSISSGLGVRQTYRISTNNFGRVLAGFQDNGSDYNSQLDSKLFLGLTSGDGLDNYTHQSDPSILYTTVQNGVIYRNYSVVAQNGTNGITEPGDWLTPFTLQEGNMNRMMAGFRNIWMSSNLNSKTGIVFNNVCNSIAYSSNTFVFDVENSPANNKHFYFCRDNGTFYKTSNINTTTPSWVDLTSYKPASGLIRDIQCDYRDSNTLYIAMGNKVYQSANGGYAWKDISTQLPSVAVYSLAIDTSSKHSGIFCGTSSGVYYRDTLTKVWSRYKAGFPDNVKVTDLEISYGRNRRSSARLFAGTYGRGIWSTTLPNFSDEKPYSKFGYSTQYNRLCKGSIMRFTDSSESPGAIHQWKVFPNKGISFENNDSNSKSTAITFNNAGKYRVSKIVKNCVGADTFSVADVIVYENVKAINCNTTTSQAGSAGDFGIRYFSLNGSISFSQKTVNGGAYQNNICKVVHRLKAGKKHGVSVAVNNLAFEYFKAYIDLNNDGKFSESTEVVMKSQFKGLKLDSLYVPVNCVKNTLLRMRLISDYQDIDTTAACPTLLFGHSEDYSVLIEEEKPYFIVDKSSICMTDSVMVSDSSTGIFLDYRWQFGNGATPATANGKGPHKVYYNTPGLKQISLTADKQPSVIRNIVNVTGHFTNSIYTDNNDTAFCKGESIVIKSLKDSSAGIAYEWHKNNVPAGITTKNLSRKNTVLTDEGPYRLINNNGCFTDTSNSLYIKVNDLPSAVFTSNLTVNKTYSLTPAVLTYSNYLWRFGDGQTSFQKTPVHTYAVAGTYTITLITTSADGCKDSSTATLIVKDGSGVYSIAKPAVLISPNPVQTYIDIQIPGISNEHTTISIYQSDGRLVEDIYSGLITNDFKLRHQFNNTTLQPGIYLICIRTGQTEQVYKIVKL